MKKIMFNDKYGLTKAVLEGRKTMTRRIIPENETKGGLVPVSFWCGKWCGSHGRPLKSQPYHFGEVVAVAQRYKDIRDVIGDIQDGKSIKSMPGWNNKMFVRADLMPHQIRITNVRVERLQDISDEDCIREGIIEDAPGLQYSFPTNIGYCGQYPYNTPREAFAALIEKVSGKGTWQANPYCFCYTFELI